jgi:hypothetical protein
LYHVSGLAIVSAERGDCDEGKTAVGFPLVNDVTFGLCHVYGLVERVGCLGGMPWRPKTPPLTKRERGEDSGGLKFADPAFFRKRK